MRNRCEGDGQRDDIGEISVLSQSTMSRSSASIARRAGREEGDEKEKSSNMMLQTLEEVGLEEGWGWWFGESACARCCARCLLYTDRGKAEIYITPDGKFGRFAAAKNLVRSTSG